MPKPQRERLLQTPNSKQIGDAAEMLVAAKLTLAGIPAFIVPVNWPGYDVVAQVPGKPLQRISVKSRDRTKFIAFDPDSCDWLAAVIVDQGNLRFFLSRRRLPSSVDMRGISRLRGEARVALTLRILCRNALNTKVTSSFASIHSVWVVTPAGPPRPARARAVLGGATGWPVG